MTKSKTPINLIYSSDLCIKLMEQPRLIITKQQIFLKMTRPNMMVAYINLNTDESKGYVAMLRTDEITLDNFIEEHQITDLAKLDNIDPGLLWIKYLAGKAEVRVEVPDIALKKIRFRVVDGCTMAYNYDRHFCDRIPQVLNMLKHFEDWLELNKGRLENRNVGDEGFFIGVIEFLKSRKEFKTKDGITLSASDDHRIRASKILKLADNRTCEIYKLYNLEEYEGEVGLLTISALGDYEADDLFTRHYPIYVNIPDLEVELTFQLRLFESDDQEYYEMVIHSLHDHFYDESKELENEEDYVAYLNSREGLLYAVYECRNKFINAR